MQRENPNTYSARVSVEQALFWTLEQYNIKLTVPLMNEVWDTMREFHPQTYAEFHAKSPAEQRRVIKVYAKLAFPEYTNLDYAKNRRKTTLGLEAATVRELWNFLKTQFPPSGVQPGFAEVTKQIEAAGMKMPDQAGPSRQLILYVQYQILNKELEAAHSRNEKTVRELEDRDRELTKRIKGMDDTAVLMPDGRHVFPDDDGNLWSLVSAKSLQSSRRSKQNACAKSCSWIARKARRILRMESRPLEAACRKQVGLGQGIGPAGR